MYQVTYDYGWPIPKGLRAGYISRWERGETTPGEYHALLLCVAFDLPARQLGLALDGAESRASARPVLDSEEVQRREFTRLTVLGLAGLAGVALAPRMAFDVARHGLISERSEANLVDWQTIVSEYGRAYMTDSPQSLIESLLVDVTSLQVTMANARLADRSELHRVGAMLAHFSALTLGNLGRLHEAGRWWRTANWLAREAGDHDAIAWVKGCELARGFYEHRPISTLLELTQEADALARIASYSALGELLVGKAQVLTILGDDLGVESTLDQLRECVAMLPTERQEQNASWFVWTENRLRFAESFAYSYRGDVAKAEAAQRCALAIYPDWYLRGPVKIELHRALALVRSGDVTSGVRHAHSVIADLNREHRDWPIIGFGQEVLHAIPSTAGHDEILVAELRNCLAMSAPPTPQ